MKFKSIIWMLFLTAIGGISMNIHHPITPTMFTELDLPSRIFGTSYAMMCFTGFLTSPMWGELSDTFGRVKPFVISCIGYGIGQILLSMCSNEIPILIARAISGIFASGVTIASMAYVVDLYDSKNRGKGMSVYIAIQSISTALGFLLGGCLAVLGFRMAITIQGVLIISIGIISILFTEESLNKQQMKVSTNLLSAVNPFSSFINCKHLMSTSMVLFLIIALITSFASTSYDSSFNYYLKAQMDFLPIYNGIIKSIVGIIGLIANFTINMWIIKKTNPRFSLIVVLLLCGISSCGIYFSSNILIFLLFNIFFFTVNAVYPPIISSLSIENKNNDEIGIISGLLNAIKSFGSVIGSLLAGAVYDISNTLPFLIALTAFIISSFLSAIYYKMEN